MRERKVIIMAIAEQFSGLDMEQLIGGPLRAAADASVQLANSTAEFINRVGFDKDGNVRNVAFGYQKNSVNEDGTTNLDEMKVAVPMLAIVPIPNLQVDEVNVLFDMEVKQSEKSEKSLDSNTSFNAGINMGIVKVNISGSVSTHQNNTRSSDNSAKYHVDVRATNHGIPEGLARVLDMMAANIAPALVDSSIKDKNGQDLPEKARIRAEKMKALNEEISQIRKSQGNLQDTFDKSLTRLRTFSDKQLYLYQDLLNQNRDMVNETYEAEKKDANGDADKIAAAEKNRAEAVEKIDTMQKDVERAWYSFRDGAAESVKLLAESDQPLGGLDTSVGLSAVVKKEDNGKTTYETDKYSSGQTHYETLSLARETAYKSWKQNNDLEKDLAKKEAEYSALSTRTAQPALEKK